MLHAQLDTCVSGADQDKTPSQQAKGRAPASDLAGARTPLAEGEEGAGEVEPPKDERSWLQKNWLILLPLGFVVSHTPSLIEEGERCFYESIPVWICVRELFLITCCAAVPRRASAAVQSAHDYCKIMSLCCQCSCLQATIATQVRDIACLVLRLACQASSKHTAACTLCLSVSAACVCVRLELLQLALCACSW